MPPAARKRKSAPAARKARGRKAHATSAQSAVTRPLGMAAASGSGSVASVRCMVPESLTLSMASEQPEVLPTIPWPTRGDQLKDDGVMAAGGYAVVRRAMDRNLLREVAVKVLHPDHAARPRSVIRFVEEAQVTGQLDHPNIVPIHEVGRNLAGEPFFTMKLVHGLTLTELLATHDPTQDPDALFEILQVFVRVCDALSFAHARGVIHRDLKPDNIMVGDFGQVYVMDWGIAQLMDGGRPSQSNSGPTVRTRSGRKDPQGLIIGTPTYMAPEQALGDVESVDDRTDVYALGGLLYYILTGRAPHGGRNTDERLRNAQLGTVTHPVDAAPNRQMPAELVRVALKALQPLSDQRYANVAALKADVESFLRRGAWFSEKRFKKGTTIVAEGKEADAAYIITQGSCEVFKGKGTARQVLRKLGPGHVFGETAIFTQRPRTASVKATTDVTAMLVTRASLEQALGMDGWMGHFVRALAERFTELEDRVAPAPARTPRTVKAKRTPSRRR